MLKVVIGDHILVVTTVLAKKKDCPKLHEATVSCSESFPDDLSAMGAKVTPRLSASTIALIKSSSAAPSTHVCDFTKARFLSIKSLISCFSIGDSIAENTEAPNAK